MNMGELMKSKPHLNWALWAFGPVATNQPERATRLLEEVVELVQACGLPREAADKVLDRVYARPASDDIPREVGQCSLTLACLAELLDIHVRDEHCKEFARVKTFPQDYWRARHDSKRASGIVHDRT